MKTSLVVMALLALVMSGGGITEPATILLISYPDGVNVTLTCTTKGSNGMIGVDWFRNNVEIFKTSSDNELSTSIREPNMTSLEYKSVSGRITVNSSFQQHNVSLRINSVDQGSEWKCETGKRFSNSVTVMVTHNTGDSSSTDHTGTTKAEPTKGAHQVSTVMGSTTKLRMTMGPTESRKKHSSTTFRVTKDQTESKKPEFIYAVAGSVGGVVVVVVIVIAVLLCKLSRKREHAKEEKSGKEGKFNEDSNRETVVMEDNDLYKQYAEMDVARTEHQLSTEDEEVIVMEDNDVYHGFVKAESQQPAEKQPVPDVYSKVNKVTKTSNAAEVQITLNIEHLYAKPNKPANGMNESLASVSSYPNVDASSPD